MTIVRHGRMDLHWCVPCDVPLSYKGRCGLCGGKGTWVECTPPGDARPAFPFDLERNRLLADGQWGEGAGALLLPEGSPVLLNPCPSPDRMDEVISGGSVVCTSAYDLKTLAWTLLLKEAGGRRLASAGFSPSKGCVTADNGAIPSVLDGSNLLCPGILKASEDIVPGQEVIVLDELGSYIGSGIAKKDGRGLVGSRGPGIKVRWAAKMERRPAAILEGGGKMPPPSWKQVWDRVLSANRGSVEKKRDDAVKFIRRVSEEMKLPLGVSFSGGKDSLATLLLALDAGFRPPVIFADTGIEFPETLSYVDSVARELSVEILRGTPRASFFDNLERFGPPGRDFRWCCKSQKLGPTAELIQRRFPGGVLTLIGQRRFESDLRERKGPVWDNPWVPLQKGASPVQDWTALDIWLYIFYKGASYNPLYERGFHRIGCWLCPSCDMAEKGLIEGTSVDRTRWEAFLGAERERRGMPEEWISLGLHRFKRLPPHLVNLLRERGAEDVIMRNASRGRTLPVLIDLIEGTNTCLNGISQEGIVGERVPMDRFASLLNILGRVEAVDDDLGHSVTPNGWTFGKAAVEVFRDGTLIIRGKDVKGLAEVRAAVISAVKRASDCIGCGICTTRCRTGALTLDDERTAIIDDMMCSHCRACLGPCPAEAYETDPYGQ